jgi:hypothetical protein
MKCAGLRRLVFIGFLVVVTGAGTGQASAAKSCQKIVLNGEVKAGQEWKQAFGQGWVFRLIPIQPGSQQYSGWDLVVDRESGAGFPDALLLATPPYRSVGEHEVGTTYGLRAQDAVGWNPRSFRFLTTPEALHQGQMLFGRLQSAPPGQAGALARSASMAGLMELQQRASTGEFRVVEARLAPGIADAAPYAEAWAHAAGRTAYVVEPVAHGQPTARGELHWMRFSVTLWLPEEWKSAPGTRLERVECVE